MQVRMSDKLQFVDALVCNPKGCQKVAGGRSAAETTGTRRLANRNPKGCQKSRVLHPFRVQISSNETGPVGLLCAPTTGYFLSALRAEVSQDCDKLKLVEL